MNTDNDQHVERKISHEKIKGFFQLIAVSTFILGAFAVSWALKANKPPLQSSNGAERVIFVEAEEISPAPYHIAFEASGSIESRATVNIVPQVTGRVIYVNEDFYAGGSFKAGETLYEVDPRDFELEVERLDAELARGRTTLNLEQAESGAALSEWRLLNGSKKAPDLVARLPQMEEAKANLKAAQAQLENAKLALERTKFTLPFDGRVIASAITKGQYISQGQSYGSAFDLDSLEVHSSLSDQQLDWLFNADNPEITVNINHLGKDLTYQGYIKRSAALLDSTTRFAQVNFGLKGDVSALIPGIFADIMIKGAEQQEVSLIPASALQKDGKILALTPEMTLKSYTPEIIHNNGSTIAVRGLGGTLNIVTSKLSGAIDGAKVRLTQPENQGGTDE